MKNDKHSLAKQGREAKQHKAVMIDVLVSPDVVREDKTQVSVQPRRKRRTNYVKKIMNDPFIFNV